MIYKYIFADRTEAEVDVDEEVYHILRKLDRKVRYNNSKNYTVSLPDNYAENIDILDEIEKQEDEEREEIKLDLEKFGQEYSKKQLQKILTERQALAYFYSHFAKMKTVHIAKIMNVTEGAIRKLINKAEVNLQISNIKNIEPNGAIKLIKAIFYADIF